MSAIQGFEEVILATKEMDGLFEKSDEKQEVVQQKLYPAYKTWFNDMIPLVISKTQQ